MDSQYKSGMESGAVANKKSVRGCDVVLRFSALVLSLTAAVVLGLAEETEMVAVTLVPSLPPVNVPATAKWHYLSAFVFFVVANSIACAYTAISLVLTLANRSGKKGMTPLIVVFDLIMVALLFCAIGASGAIGLMGYKGNSRVRWNKVCNVFDKFCRQGASALALSGAAAGLFLVLVVRAIFNLHKRH